MNVTHVNKDFDLKRVVPFFQPIMDLSSQAVWRYECLTRLLDTEQQPFLPSDFLYLVERRQSVANLTQTIFNRCANYFRNINMAWNINVSLEDMLDPEIALFIRAQLQHYPEPNRISIEVTARNALEHLPVFTDFALFCRDVGIGITLDHFELLDCNFEQVMALPIEAVKVSGNYIKQAKQQEDLQPIITHLRQVANASHVTLIAEHIESKEILTLMQDFGFNYAQGFYFCEPQATIQ